MANQWTLHPLGHSSFLKVHVVYFWRRYNLGVRSTAFLETRSSELHTRLTYPQDEACIRLGPHHSFPVLCMFWYRLFKKSLSSLSNEGNCRLQTWPFLCVLANGGGWQGTVWSWASYMWQRNWFDTQKLIPCLVASAASSASWRACRQIVTIRQLHFQILFQASIADASRKRLEAENCNVKSYVRVYLAPVEGSHILPPFVRLQKKLSVHIYFSGTIQ